MKKILYLLRKPLDQINPALFLASESQGDVVLLDGTGDPTFSYAGGTVFTLDCGDANHRLTYDDLVKKIFNYEHTVVI
jgi:regulator of RNase E activity RraA